MRSLPSLTRSLLALAILVAPVSAERSTLDDDDERSASSNNATASNAPASEGLKEVADNARALARLWQGARSATHDAFRYYAAHESWRVRNEAPAVTLQSLIGTTRAAAALGLPVDLPRMFFRPMPLLTSVPVDGSLSSPYGFRRDPINKRRRKHHNGVDFHAKRHAEVRAAGPGLVVKAGRYYGYGRVVFIDHGLGIETRYAHLQSIVVEEGEFVFAESPIGTVGSSGRATGPHLHFEVRLDEVPIPPESAMDVQLFPRNGWFARIATVLRSWQRTCAESIDDPDLVISRCASGPQRRPSKKRRTRRSRRGPAS